ncbi:MAG TPA: RNase adapter RapZ [Ignavibacteriaceae bacterium]
MIDSHLKLDLIKNIFLKWYGKKADFIQKLPQTASYREYYRISYDQKTVIGVFNEDLKENEAFLSFSKTFDELNFNVPKVLFTDLDNSVYVLNDIGDTTLYSLIHSNKHDYNSAPQLVGYYKKALEQLLKFQIIANKKIDYNYCYPRAKFDRQSILWDLNYFKYDFLKLGRIGFDEQLLENDFQRFSEFVAFVNTDYFLYRDFQSRNIMIKDDDLYFIDYQGGRKGALQYDVASLLYDAKAEIPNPLRESLLNHYLDKLESDYDLDRTDFLKSYYAFVLIRIMQAMGAYGFRGLFEKKVHLVKSILPARKNLKYLLDSGKLDFDIPHLHSVFENIITAEEFNIYEDRDLPNNKLNVTITSFSYKREIPIDLADNGGGFVFDCRGLNNPGRHLEFKLLNGRDAEVIKYLEENSDVEEFLSHTFPLVDSTIETYLDRGFKNLMINFGCTGGQHRSVYCADKLFNHIKSKYDINIFLSHIEQGIKEEVIR